LLLYRRRHAGDCILVALNLGPEPTAVAFPPHELGARLLLSSYCDRVLERIENDLVLRGHEGVAIRLAG
jgi:alpha-glucosidase